MKIKVNRETGSMMAILSLGMIARSLLQPVLPLYLSSIEISPEVIGLMLSVNMAGMFMGELFWGKAADRSGFVIPVTAGTYVSGLTVLLFLFTRSRLLLFGIFFLWGFLRAALFSPVRGYIGTNAPAARKATFMSISAVIMYVSKALGTLPGGFLAESFGYSSVFIAACITSAAAGLIMLTWKGRVKPASQHRIRESSGEKVFVKDKSIKKADYVFALRCCTTAFHFAGLGLFMGFMPLLAYQAGGVSAAGVGILFTIYSIASIITSIPVGVIADRRRDKNRFLACGLAVSGLSLAGMALFPTFAMLAVFSAMKGVGMALFSPASLAVVSETSSPERQGTAMGLYGAFGENTGIFTGLALGGFIWSVFSPGAAFFAGFISCAVGLVFLKISIIAVKHWKLSVLFKA